MLDVLIQVSKILFYAFISILLVEGIVCIVINPIINHFKKKKFNEQIDELCDELIEEIVKNINEQPKKHKKTKKDEK